MNTTPAFVRRAAGVVLVLGAAVAVAAGTSAASPSAAPPGANLAPTKTYLLKHTSQLRGFTTRFQREANRYFALAKASDFDYAALWARRRRRSGPCSRARRRCGSKGNPYYERVEGVVAGTPSLSVYDVILDAGSSAKEDPASAVPFDLKLADGRVLREAGQPLQPHRGDALGNAAPVHRQGRQGRPRRRREGRVRRGASGCGGLQGRGRRVRPLRRASSTARPRVEADALPTLSPRSS